MLHKILKRILVLLVLVVSGFPAAAAPPGNQAASAAKPIAAREAVIGGVKVAYWMADPAPSHAPVIVFSHGVGACPTDLGYLTAALAKHGYVVIAPNHPDSSCGGKGMPKGAMDFFYKPELWKAQTFRHRDMEIRDVIAALKTDPKWAPHVDTAKIGLMGHSLGGYTVLSLAGAWPEWKTDGVKAVLALAPYAAPFLKQGSLADIRVPVMYQTAAWDKSVTETVKGDGGIYDKTAAPAWYVEYGKFDHQDFKNIRKNDPHAADHVKVHEDIVYYSEWFFDHTLKGAKAKPEKRPETADFRAK